jgi:hypothetical protein
MRKTDNFGIIYSAWIDIKAHTILLLKGNRKMAGFGGPDNIRDLLNIGAMWVREGVYDNSNYF